MAPKERANHPLAILWFFLTATGFAVVIGLVTDESMGALRFVLGALALAVSALSVYELVRYLWRHPL